MKGKLKVFRSVSISRWITQNVWVAMFRFCFVVLVSFFLSETHWFRCRMLMLRFLRNRFFYTGQLSTISLVFLRLFLRWNDFNIKFVWSWLSLRNLISSVIDETDGLSQKAIVSSYKAIFKVMRLHTWILPLKITFPSKQTNKKLVFLCRSVHQLYFRRGANTSLHVRNLSN